MFNYCLFIVRYVCKIRVFRPEHSTTIQIYFNSHSYSKIPAVPRSCDGSGLFPPTITFNDCVCRAHGLGLLML